MKDFKGTKIIGVDNGYGNTKTANHCFRTGILSYDAEPLFTRDMLVYNGRYYLIGEGHKEFIGEKTGDDEFYLLTLAAIAMELNDAGLTEADVFIAAGLPLTWTAGQKGKYREYLTQNKEVSFTFRKEDYHIRIVGAAIYPQGYAAIAQQAAAMEGMNMVADIGNGTMNVLYVCDGNPLSSKMYTEKCGTYQCTLAVQEAYSREMQSEISYEIIEKVLRTGTDKSIAPAALKLIRSVAADYVADVFRRLREHGNDENTMMLYISGGGGCLVKNFYKFKPSRVVFVEDICAAAKGYEYFAEMQMEAGVIG